MSPLVYIMSLLCIPKLKGRWDSGWSCPLRQALQVLLLGGLAGCASPAEVIDLGLAHEQEPARLDPLEYYEWVKQADMAQIIAERSRLLQEEEIRRPREAVQLSLLLSAAPLTAPAGEVEAERVLSNIRKARLFEADSSPYRTFAEIWVRELNRRMEIRESAAYSSGLEYENKTLQQEIRVLRGQLTGAAGQQHELEQQVDHLQEQIIRLEEQIEALTSLEQQMIERERSSQGTQ